jgi:hypothetical protein
MRFESFSFGSIRIDGVTYEHDVVIDRGEVSKRKKKPSQQFREVFGHTPLSTEEEIPWKCRQLVIGTGTGGLPVMDQVKREAQRRRVELSLGALDSVLSPVSTSRAGRRWYQLAGASAARWRVMSAQ